MASFNQKFSYLTDKLWNNYRRFNLKCHLSILCSNEDTDLVADEIDWLDDSEFEGNEDNACDGSDDSEESNDNITKMEPWQTSKI